MIKTENLITTIEFGTREKASIAVSVDRNILILQMLATEKKIQDPLVKEDIQDLPKIEMEFHNRSSIDVVIEGLMVLKRNFVDQNQIALAC